MQKFHVKIIVLISCMLLTVTGTVYYFTTKNNPTVGMNAPSTPTEPALTPILPAPTPTESPLPTIPAPAPTPPIVIIPPVPTPPPIIESPEQILLHGMKLTFDEEFNSFSRYLDASGNVTCNSGGKGIWQTVYQFCSRTSPANQEAEVYIDQNFIDYLNSQSDIKTTARSPFTVHNGIMSIEVSQSDAAILKAAGSWAVYTSGLLTTEYSFSQLYGYFEIRAKLPVGKGVWPAFWLLPADKSWPPEIDIFEAFGGPNPRGEGGVRSIRHASHPLNNDEACGQWHDVGTDITKGFHTYGVDWEATGITYYFDGVPYATCKPNTAANKPFFILANVAVGGPGSWPGMPDNSNTWPVTMDIDYIRAYQKK